jgi:anti-sigma B factor antagonist
LAAGELKEDNFQIEIRGRGDRRVMALCGDLDMSTAPQFDEAVQDLCADGVRQLILDLRLLRFTDTTGLRTMLWGYSFCTERGCRCFIDPELPDSLKRLFAITGIASGIPFMARDAPEGDMARPDPSH